MATVKDILARKGPQIWSVGKEATVLQAAQFMGAAQDLQAAVFNGAFIQRDEGAEHVWESEAIAVPVTVILVPFPRATAVRLLEHDLAVIKRDLFAHQDADRVHDTRRLRGGGPNIIAQFQPDGQFRRFATVIGVTLGRALHTIAAFHFASLVGAAMAIVSAAAAFVTLSAVRPPPR